MLFIKGPKLKPTFNFRSRPIYIKAL